MAVLAGVAVEPVELGRVKPQDVALVVLVQLRIVPALRDALRDLEPPERLDLPLRAAVPERVRSEDDVLRTLVPEQLPEDVRGHRWERHHRGGEGGPDLGVGVLEVAGELRVRRRPVDVRHSIEERPRPRFARLDLRQRLVVEERVLDAGVVGEEVQVRPVLERLGQVGRIAVLRPRRQAAGKPLVYGDDVAPRTQLVLADVLADQLERRVGHVLVIVPPLPHHARVDLRRVGDVVALPGVGVVVIDLVLDVVQVPLADVEQPVRHRPSRAGQLVDEVTPRGGLLGGEDLARACVLHVLRRLSRVLAARSGRERGDVADHADSDLAVEVEAADEVDDVEHILGDGQSDQRRVPHAPRVAVLVGHVVRVERVAGEPGRRRPLRDRAQGHCADAGGAAHEVELVVDDEQVLRRAVLGVVGLEHLLLLDVEELAAVHLVHGEEGRRHAPARAEETPAADPKLLRRAVGQLLHPRFHLLLRLALRGRHVLPVRDHARRHRRREIGVLGVIRARALRELLVAEQGVVVFPLASGFLPVVGSRHVMSP